MQLRYRDPARARREGNTQSPPEDCFCQILIGIHEETHVDQIDA